MRWDPDVHSDTAGYPARAADTPQVRVIRALSARGIVVGTVESAQLPALYAATSPDAGGGRLYGPSGLGNLGGPPAEQALWRPLRSGADAERIWQLSEEFVDDRSQR